MFNFENDLTKKQEITGARKRAWDDILLVYALHFRLISLDNFQAASQRRNTFKKMINPVSPSFAMWRPLDWFIWF